MKVLPGNRKQALAFRNVLQPFGDRMLFVQQGVVALLRISTRARSWQRWTASTRATSLIGSEQNSFRLLQQSDQPTAGTNSPAALPTHSQWNCPLCGGTMQVVERLSAAQLFLRSPPHLTGAPHESTSPASNLAPAPARTLVLCLAFVGTQYGGAIQTLRCAAPPSFSLRSATETQAP